MTQDIDQEWREAVARHQQAGLSEGQAVKRTADEMATKYGEDSYEAAYALQRLYHWINAQD